VAGNDIVMSQVGVEENQLVRPQCFQIQGAILGGQKIGAAVFIRRQQFLRFLFGAAVVGVNIEQPPIAIFLPGDKVLGIAVECIEEPNLADFFRKSAVVQNGGDDVIPSAVTG